MTGLSDAHVRFWFDEHFRERLEAAKPSPPSENPGIKGAREDQGNVHSQAAQQSTPNLPDLPELLKPLKFFLRLDPAVPYLRERGLSDATIQRYGLGLCNRDMLKGYVAIPVYNWRRPDGQLPVAYFGRWAGDDFDEAQGRPRYKWLADSPKQQVVYGLHEALRDSDPARPLVVVGVAVKPRPKLGPTNGRAVAKP